jgi:hypothetical protein
MDSVLCNAPGGTGVEQPVLAPANPTLGNTQLNAIAIAAVGIGFTGVLLGVSFIQENQVAEVWFTRGCDEMGKLRSGVLSLAGVMPGLAMRKRGQNVPYN